MIKKRRYLDYEILKAENEGYKVFSEGCGSVSMDKRSSLFRAYNACKTVAYDVIYVVGGGRRSLRERDWAVMYRPRQEAPGKANGHFEEIGVVSETLLEESYSLKRAAAVSVCCDVEERGREDA